MKICFEIVQGKSALHFAVINGDIEVFKLLLGGGRPSFFSIDQIPGSNDLVQASDDKVNIRPLS
jgi:hypothetical protein